MFYTLGVGVAFLLGLLLFTKKGKTQADKILACWLFAIALHLLLFYLHFTEVAFHYPVLLGLHLPLPLIHGPFLFLYTASVTNEFAFTRWKPAFHFIPAISCYLYLASYFALPAAKKVFIFRHNGLGYETFQIVNLLAIVLSGIVYVAWTNALLKRHKIAIQNYFSDTEKINLKWLQYLVYGIAIIWILILANDKFLFAGAVLFVLFIGYFGIKQVGIFTDKQHHPQLHPVSNQRTVFTRETEGITHNFPENRFAVQKLVHAESAANAQEPTVLPVFAEEIYITKKYSKSGLTGEMGLNLHEKLNNLMKTEKSYTESKLSLAELAKRLDTLPNYLSQVINEKEGKTFYDYINALRIEEFKRLVSLPENQKYTIESLSYECGFNSKSSFNKNFRKVTEQSPSEYLQSVNMGGIYSLQMANREHDKLQADWDRSGAQQFSG
jgi:AraC-like DNA-binding protein